MTLIVDLPAATQLQDTDILLMDNGSQTQQVPFSAIRRDANAIEAVVDSAPSSFRYVDFTAGTPEKVIHFKDVPAAAAFQNIYLAPAPVDLGNNNAYKLIVMISMSAAGGLKLNQNIAQLIAPGGWTIAGNWTGWTMAAGGANTTYIWHFTILPSLQLILVG